MTPALPFQSLSRLRIRRLAVLACLQLLPSPYGANAASAAPAASAASPTSAAGSSAGKPAASARSAASAAPANPADNGNSSGYPASLARADRSYLEQIGCRDPFALDLAGLNAFSLSPGGRANYADLRCRPHASLQGRPLYYVRQCARDQGEWLCGDAELETSIALGTRQLTIRPGTLEPARAIDTVAKVASYHYYLGMNIDQALESTCNLGMGDRKDLVEISCRRWSITVSYWCPKETGKYCPRVIYMHQR